MKMTKREKLEKEYKQLNMWFGFHALVLAVIFYGIAMIPFYSIQYIPTIVSKFSNLAVQEIAKWLSLVNLLAEGLFAIAFVAEILDLVDIRQDLKEVYNKLKKVKP